MVGECELTKDELVKELFAQREYYQNVIARMEAELSVLRRWFKESKESDKK